MRGQICMIYLWEILLEAEKSGIDTNKITFVHGPLSSPYMELSLEYLNQENISGFNKVEVNTYYRFYKIFKELFQPELTDYEQLRSSLTNLILHMLMENDVRRGMTKEAYYKKLLAADIKAGCYGKDAEERYLLFKGEERELLLSSLLKCYKSGSSLTLFVDMIHNMLNDSVTYHSQDLPDELLIYTGQRKNKNLEMKIRFLTDVFLDIRYHVEIFYEYHFGIIGLEDTMIIDEIAMY